MFFLNKNYILCFFLSPYLLFQLSSSKKSINNNVIMEFKLIIKKLNKTLSQDEEIVFSEWYNESKDHKDYFDSVKNNHQVDIDQIDVEEGWLTLQSKLKSNKPKYRFIKYAVAASMLLLLSINFIFNKKEVAKVDLVTIAKESKIKPGTDKAILTLEDGSEMVLGKGSVYQTKSVKSNGKTIVYNSNDKKSNKIIYNYLTIPRGGQFFVKLSDGTQVWLNSESQLKFPVSFIPGETRKVELVYGEAYFDVSPSTAHGGDKFQVLNQFQKVEVIGTEFNIKAYKEDSNLYTTLVKGKVTVENGDFKQNLLPNQQSNLDLKNKSISINTIDVNTQISWKNGLFIFKEMSLKEIMKVVSRWYDVDVIFENKDLEKVKFKGILSKDQSIEEILLIMKSTTIKSYEIKNRIITIK